MSGTRAYAARRALIDLLENSDDLEGVQVAYSWPGERAERECIHGGRATFQHEAISMRAGARIPRLERLTLPLHVVAQMPGGTVEDAEERATELGEVVEHILALCPPLSDDGLFGLVSGGRLDSDIDDDGAWAVLTYTVLIQSRLT